MNCIILLSGHIPIGRFEKTFLIKIRKNQMTNIIELRGNWLEQRRKLKENFAALTDEDLLFEQGKKEEMLEKVQVKLGKTKEELRKIIEAL